MYAENTGQVEEFLTILKKRKWQIILPSVFILALSIVLALIIPGKYLIEAKFELRHVRVEKDRDLRNPNAAATSLEVENAEDHLKSFERVQKVISDLGWDEYANLKDDTLRKEYIKDQVEAINAVTPAKANQRESAFISISYKHVNPRKGVQFVRSLVDTWARDLSARDEALLIAERNGLQNDVNSSKRIYRESLSHLKRLEEEMGLLAWNPPGMQGQSQTQDPVTSELSDVRMKMGDLQTERAGITGQLDVIRERLPQMEDFVSQQVTGEPGKRGVKMASLESQIAGLRASQRGLTPLHSTYKRLQLQIEQLEEQLRLLQDSPDKVIQEVMRVPNTDKEKLEEDRKALEIQLSEVNGKLAEKTRREQELQSIISKRISLSREHEEVLNEVGVNEELYNEAQKDLRRKEDALAGLVRANKQPFIWSKQPFAPADPSEPNPLLIIAIGLVGGLAVGLGSSVLVEFSKNCYRNVGDVTAVMTLPVLGVVNEIITSQQRRASRFRGFVMVSSSVVMLAVIGWFTWAYTRKPEILPTGVLLQIEEFRSNFE